ncbi:MAG: GMC family oxidoreductase N-terminal domain-containing protein [Pseudomonadota bacterium]
MTNDAYRSLDAAVAEFSSGKVSRRDFIRKATALGLSAGMAGALATAWSGQVRAQSTTTTDIPAGDFDYIVVGSGSAGSAAVHQLAKSGARILVLEAGREDNLEEIHNPVLWGAALGTDATKWFQTLPSIHSDGRTHLWPRGNVLGGSSAINVMVYVRGHRSDFDTWAEMGATGWSFEDVLPAFIDMETFEPGGANRGSNGPLFVSQPTDDKKHPGAQAFIEAATAMGFTPTESINSERLEGPAWIDFNIKDLRRQSAATAFLAPAMEVGNVTLLTDAPVQRLDIEGTTCTGVTYLHNGAPVSVRAGSEVILAAGAIDSPRLLMVSGIGPAEDLADVGIDAIVDLPVGEGLQDHILGAGVTIETHGPIETSHYNHCEAVMWERSDAALRAPDTVALYASSPFVAQGHSVEFEHGFSLLSGVATPASRGYVKLASPNIDDDPIIEANYLAEEQDWNSYRASTEICREIGASASYNDVRKRELLPEQDGELTEAEWREFLAKSVNTYFHPTSTCQIAKVVDPELRVYGINGLRVADASVMPIITTTNTNAASMMIGWRVGEMITAS